MRVIVTGGTGMIGSALAESLAKDGHEVIVLTRSPEKSRGNLPAGVRAEGWDAKSANGWGKLADGADAIVNLAGENLSSGRWTPAIKRRILESRHNAGKAVVQAVEQAVQKPKVVIQSSAVGYYGPRGDEIITEKDEHGSDFLSTICMEWERSTAAVEDMGVRRVILRTGIVLSLEGGAFPPFLIPFRLFAGGPMGSGKQWFPWIHMADEVGAIRFLIENKNASGPYNLSAPNPVTNRQFGQVLGKVMRRPAILPAPAFAFQLLFGEMATLILDGQREIPARLLEAGYQFCYPEPEPALREILSKK